jgi:hypothetical protein
MISQGAWRDDFERVSAALEPFVIEINGEQFIDPDSAPTGLSDLYSKLTSIGYAYGWLSPRGVIDTMTPNEHAKEAPNAA